MSRHRKEFPKAIQSACIKRATRAVGETELSNIYCEECHVLVKKWQIDHVNPDAMTGKPTLENAMLLCIPCHAEKTAKDVGDIAKAKRREGKAIGVKTVAPNPIMSAGFPEIKKPKHVSRHNPLNRRSVYANI